MAQNEGGEETFSTFTFWGHTTEHEICTLYVNEPIKHQQRKKLTRTAVTYRSSGLVFWNFSPASRKLIPTLDSGIFF